MTPRDLRDLLLLAALWGASFLFTRLGAVDFGPVALAFIRVAGASLLLLPLAAFHAPSAAALRLHWRPIAVVGLVGSALPFMLFAVAALVLTTALMSAFNATTPIWGTLLAWLWLADKPGRTRLAGLVVGMAGVVGVTWAEADFKPVQAGVSPLLGMAACVAAAALYGLGAVMSRRWLGGVPPMAVAAGSQVSATVALALPAAWAWPAVTPGATAWLGAAVLAFGCTGLAYLLYFRLIAHAGATRAVSVTLLIPAFATLWGWLFLTERPTATVVAGCAVILFAGRRCRPGSCCPLGLHRRQTRFVEAAERPVAT